MMKTRTKNVSNAFSRTRYLDFRILFPPLLKREIANWFTTIRFSFRTKLGSVVHRGFLKKKAYEKQTKSGSQSASSSAEDEEAQDEEAEEDEEEKPARKKQVTRTNLRVSEHTGNFSQNFDIIKPSFFFFLRFRTTEEFIGTAENILSKRKPKPERL